MPRSSSGSSGSGLNPADLDDHPAVVAQPLPIDRAVPGVDDPRGFGQLLADADVVDERVGNAVLLVPTARRWSRQD